MKKKYSIIKKLTTLKLTFAIVILNCLFSNAQNVKQGATVSTNSGSGLASSYATLDAAITALNAATISSPVVINLNVPQIAPLGGYAITAEGTTVNTITINGNNNVVTANAGLTAGSISDAIFKLVGADYVTLQNFTIIENPANTVNTPALNNTMTEWGVALLYATTTNGAQNNTIANNTITLNRTYTNTFGIYSNSTHSATAPSTSATATTATGSNTGLSILSNTISNVNLGIVVVGPTAAADHNQSVTIGGLTTGNTITDFSTGAALSTFANVSATSYGILVRNTANFSISYNTITSSNGGYTGASAYRGIFIPAFSNAPVGNLVQTINNNTISLRPAASVAITGITTEATTGNATSSLSISNNDFIASTHTVAATSAMTFISNLMAHLNTSINGNTFTNMSVLTSGSVNFIANSVARPANAVCNVNNNRIINGFIKTTAGGTVSFYNSASTTPNTGTETNSGNNFSNISVTGTTSISGWVCADGATTTPFGPSKTITNNIFSNIIGGSGTIAILTASLSNANGNSTVSNNTISNITGGGSMVGLISSQGRQIITNNTVTNLSTAGNAVVNGISITGGTNQTVTKNKIGNLESTNTTGSVNGLLISGGLLVNATNNLIGNLVTPIRNSTTDGVRGISITSTAATSNVNIYNNSITIAAVSTGTDFSTSGIFHTTNATATTAVLDLRNNIIVNTSTSTGAGNSVAFRRSSAVLTNFAATSNNNDLVAPIIFADGTNTSATIVAYQTLVAPREALSITAIPTFLSVVTSNPNFLHIDGTVTSPIESGASVIATVTDDFDGDIRQGAGGYTGTGTAPDMGADEFESTLSTTSFDDSNFVFYPNPTNGILNIIYTTAISEVTVMNLLGQTVMITKTNDLNVQIDLSSLSRAAYLVKVIADGQEKVIKVLKQ